jgi:pimeloyl-ACP methyl ester carboxylesterase
VIGTQDHAIPVAAQEFMAKRAHAKVTKINAPHLSMIANPAKVAAVIESAARESN